MKQIRNLLIIVLVLNLQGCTKDFLDPKSISTFDKVLVFSNVDDARKATNNIYTEFGQDGYRTRLSITMQANSDINAGGDQYSAKDNYQIIALHAVPGNADLTKAWNSAYSAISKCNFVIDGILESEAYNSTDDAIREDMHQFIGEAYAIRAFWYSQLVYNWGDVPFSRESARAGVDFNVPKTDRNEILSSVIQDLIDAEESMKWADQLPQACQQVNREYAIGMIVRLSLQRGGYYLKPDMTKAVPDDREEYYQLAKTYALKLMTLKDRELPTDFWQVFKNQCENIYPTNSDMLFEVPFAITTGEVGYNVGMRIASGTHPYGLAGHDFSMPLSYYYSFDEKDKRREATCGMYNLDKDLIPSIVSGTDISQAKWSKFYCNPPLGAASAKGTGINWPMMRYADVLLMFAEAENELNGPTQAAKDALRRVRQRAFNSEDWPVKVDAYINSVSADKESFFDAIVDEHAWEFGGELQRKNSLIRWGIYEEKMAETVSTLQALGDEAIVNDPGATHASYIYWRVDNKRITIYQGVLNSNTPPPGYIPSTGADTDGTTLPLDGWNKSNWTTTLKSETTGLYNASIDKQFGPYLTSIIRYIQPIPSVAIDNSEGVLKNDGYGF
jgi:hypothetical protein